MAHFKTDTRPGIELPEEAWKDIQAHMGLSDEELAIWRKDKKKLKCVPLMGSPVIGGKSLVVEVVKSHGCPAGMKVGDKLYFAQAAGGYDGKRSDPFCAFALTYLAGVSNTVHVLHCADKEHGSSYFDTLSCPGCGSNPDARGQILMKARVIDEPPAE